MLDLKSPRQDAEVGVAMRCWNFDTALVGCGQQGINASWK